MFYIHDVKSTKIADVDFVCRKYENGAVGSLTHLVALQGHDYSCELEVYADGYQLKYAIRIYSRLTAPLTSVIF